jgi:hypothetical protein
LLQVSLLFYGTLWETADVAVSWRPVLMTEVEAEYLQAVARQTLLATQAAAVAVAGGGSGASG